MNYNDHNPPHIHVEYQDCEAIIMIKTGEVCGQMSKRGLNLIWECISHKLRRKTSCQGRLEEKTVTSFLPFRKRCNN